MSSTPHSLSSGARLLAACLAALTLIGPDLTAANLNTVRHFSCDLSAQPDPRSLLAFDLSVLNPHAELDMEPGHALGHRYLALLDVTSFRTGSREAMLAAGRKLPSTPAAEDSRLRFTDFSHPQWLPWAVESFVDPVAKKGFDGFAVTLGRGEPTPAARMARRTAMPLWLPRLSSTTTSPGLSVGTRNCWTQARKITLLMGPSTTQGASIRSERSAARKVMVFQ